MSPSIIMPIRVFIIGTDGAVLSLFNKHPAFYAKDQLDDPNPKLDDYDMIVFTGGSDVNPEYYGEKPLNGTHYVDYRDQRELSIYWQTLKTHYHFGICRGLQLLAVANGSKLWQHIDGHSWGTHGMVLTRKHPTLKTKIIGGVTTCHHQAVRVDNNNRNNILAYEESKTVARSTYPDKPVFLERTVEAVYFPETRSFGVQGHPEYGDASKEYKDFVFYHLLENPETKVLK